MFLSCENISKSYGENKVLTNINLEFNQNEIVAIVGKSGSGKSTLLNIIGLLENRDSGSLLFNGENVSDINSKKAIMLRRNFLGYVFQNFALIEEKSVLDNLVIAQKYSNKTKKEKMKEIDDVLDMIGIANLKNNYVYQLSGGQQQKVAIARILLKQCEVILADEPTGSLDEENKKDIFNLFCELKNKQKCVIIVTHDLALADKCDRVINILDINN